jgi:WD40 repeat protein
LLDTASEKASRIEVPPDLRADFYTIAFSPDGEYCAVGGVSGTLLLFDSKHRSFRANLQGHPARVYALAFSPNSRLLASASGGDWDGGKETPDANMIRIWDMKTTKAVAVLEKLPLRPDALAFSPDGKTLVSAGLHPPIRFWDVEKKQQIGKLPCSAECLAYSPDGKLLASGGYDPRLRGDYDPRLQGDGSEPLLRLWDPKEREELRTIRVPGTSILSLAFSSDGKTVLTGGNSQTLHLWDVATGQEVHPRPGHLGAVFSVAFSPDGKTLASRSGDNTVRLWDLATGKEQRQFPIGDGPFFTREAWNGCANDRSVLFSPDGRHVAALAGSGLRVWNPRAYIWDAASGRKEGEVRESRHTPLALGFSSDSQFLGVSAGEGVRFCSVTTREEVRLITPGGNYALAFSPDGDMVAGGAGTGSLGLPDPLRLWNWKSGTLLRTYKPERSGISALAFSPGGHFLATGESSIRVRETSTFTAISSLLFGGDNLPSSLAFAPSGWLLASAHEDGSVRLWDVFSEEELARFRGHRGVVRSVAFSPDGKTLASGGDDTTILLWDVSKFRPHLPPRALTADESARLWAALKGGDKENSPYQALWLLACGGDKAVAYLQEQVSPVPETDLKRVQQLITDLEDADFAKRQAATAELSKLGPLAEPALREALKGEPSAQLRKSANELLEKIQAGPVSGDDLRQMRALLALELIGSPPARDLLRKLAGGAAGARLTRDAKAALERLKRMPATPDAPPKK